MWKIILLMVVANFTESYKNVDIFDYEYFVKLNMGALF